MELVEGENLRQRLKRGPIAIKGFDSDLFPAVAAPQIDGFYFAARVRPGMAIPPQEETTKVPADSRWYDHTGRELWRSRGRCSRK